MVPVKSVCPRVRGEVEGGAMRRICTRERQMQDRTQTAEGYYTTKKFMECHLIAATSSSYIHPLSRLLQDRAQGLHAYINYNNRTIS